MRMPKIGGIVDNKLAINLCRYYQFDEIASRIEADPEQFKEWRFDGASSLPDNLVALALDVDQEKFSEAALKHDLKYAYGAPGDKAAKHLADKELEQNLIEVALKPYQAKMMYTAVDLGGGEKRDRPYSWAFAKTD